MITEQHHNNSQIKYERIIYKIYIYYGISTYIHFNLKNAADSCKNM